MSWQGDVGNTILGQNKYNIQTAQYDPTRPDEERALALQQRGQQQQLAQAIQARALGQGGPSVAELQGQRGLAQAQQQAMQMAASGRGIDRAAAFRQAQMGQANMASEANSQAAMLRAQEQIAAQGLGANVNQGIRGQDIEGRGISAQEQLGQMNAATQAEQLRAQQAQANAENKQKATMGALVAAGGLLSDMRAKEDIHPLALALERARQPAIDRINAPVEPGSRAALAPVQPYSYRYKPEFAQALGQDQGQRVGVMAQDLERSPAYAPAVIETPMGKALDKDRLLQANTAQLGGIDKRLAELEAARGKAIERVNEPIKKNKNKGLAEALDKAGPAAVRRVQEPVSPKERGRR